MALTLLDFPIKTPLTDISGRLRKLADDIDSGKEEVPSTFVGIAYSGQEPSIFCFGDCPTRIEAIGLLTVAQLILSKTMTEPQ